MACSVLLLAVYFVLIAGGAPNQKSPLAPDQLNGANEKIKADVVVALDGTGDFTTVQEAINAAPNKRTTYFYIYIKKGSYKEVITIPKNKDHIYLYGEDAKYTILTFDNYAKRLKPDGAEYGTSGSASFFANGNFFVAENLTFANTAGMNAGQALAINIGGLRSSFRNCRFLGHQDTWYAGSGTFQYLRDCYIEGSVDFIFGGSTAFFDECHIQSTRNGYITAASTPEGQSFGYIFRNCSITAYPTVAPGSVYLGRPWRPHASVVFLQPHLGKHIRSEGWHNWGKTANETTAFYAEYKSAGEGASPDTRVAWSHQLTSNQATDYTYENTMGSQHPGFVDDGVAMK
ncbi:pectin esterase [Sphingobacterium olei]|uniref:Pectinesterase n=2 Tax=Sphingobacterium olei TaxID=2571155 RepID=A0A4U0P4X7_9SPHI|nr:pectin esterase [Sphingobacterium olei]